MSFMVLRKFFQPNWGVILRLTGWLLAIDALLMLVVVIVGMLQDGCLSYHFLVTAFVTGGVGLLLSRFVRPVSDKISLRDALFLTAFLWIVFSVTGAVPFMYGECRLGVVDALFESVSGYTSTGASVIRDVETCPAAILLWRALTQWIGGIGIIMFSIAIIPMLNNREGIQLFNSEVSGITSEKLRPRISETAMGIGAVYLAMTLIEFILLWAGPMDMFDSLCQTLSTVSTGGFSTRNSSIAAWNSDYVNWVIIVFMFLGGINFQLLYLSVMREPSRLVRNDTFRCYLAIVIISSLLITVKLLASHSAVNGTGHSVVASFFTVVSAISSTGFSLYDYEGWGTIVIIIIMIIMFFGACAGSTTSGAKIDRLIFLARSTRNSFYRIVHPNHVQVVRVNGCVIPEQSVNKVIGFLSIYVLIVIACCMAVAAFGESLEDALFASISCMSNIGLGYGSTGVHGSFADLDTIPKIVLTVEMLVGRLEIFTFLIVFTPFFWRR